MPEEGIDKGIKTDISAYPTDEVLTQRYSDIEATALAGIREGLLIGNPTLAEFFRGEKWSISTQGFVMGSPAGQFLVDAIDQLRAVEPGISFINPEHLHITFTEVAFNKDSRKAGGFDKDKLMSYHQAILKNFPKGMGPIKLQLNRILPALDPPVEGVNGRTGALVAGFLTGGDVEIFKVREQIAEAVKAGELEIGSSYGGPPKVLFVTLGRFAQPVTRDGDNIPLLGAIEEINRSITPDVQTDINEIKVISTSPLDYKSPRGHLELWPPVALAESDQKPLPESGTRFVRPTQRGK